jgi:hypothetical protein
MEDGEWKQPRRSERTRSVEDKGVPKQSLGTRNGERVARAKLRQTAAAVDFDEGDAGRVGEW